MGKFRARPILGLFALVATFAVAQPSQVESPPVGIAPSVFATEFRGCLGPLRSALAQEVGFHADFNPGKHQGTVGEAEFLLAVAEFGIANEEGLRDFCSYYE